MSLFSYRESQSFDEYFTTVLETVARPSELLLYLGKNTFLYGRVYRFLSER